MVLVGKNSTPWNMCNSVFERFHPSKKSDIRPDRQRGRYWTNSYKVLSYAKKRRGPTGAEELGQESH